MSESPERSFEIRELLNNALMFIFLNIGGASYKDLYSHLYGEHTTSNFLYPLLDTVLKELEDQGLICINKRMSEDITLQDKAPFYFITYKGIRFCRKPIIGYRGRPFHYAIFLERLSVLWDISKVIGVIAISIATFLISYLTYVNQ